MKDPFTLVQANQPNVIIETIKQAEDGEGIIVRMYEFQRKRGKVDLLTGFPIRSALVTNLLEENQDEIPLAAKDRVTLDISPYQIITLRLVLDGGVIHG